MPQRAFVNGWYGFERLLFLQIDFAKWFFAQFGFGFVFVCSGYTFFSVVCAFVRWKRPPVQRNFASFAIFFFLAPSAYLSRVLWVRLHAIAILTVGLALCHYGFNKFAAHRCGTVPSNRELSVRSIQCSLSNYRCHCGFRLCRSCGAHHPRAFCRGER